MKPMYLFNREPRQFFDLFVFDSEHKVLGQKRTFATQQGAYMNAMIYQEQLKGAFFQVKEVVKEGAR